METMTLLHESDGRAFALAAARHARRLRVLEGRAWITRTQRKAGEAMPEDLWLGPGDTLELPPGSAWVVQAVGPLRLCQQRLSGAPAWALGARLAAVLPAWAWPRRHAF